MRNLVCFFFCFLSVFAVAGPVESATTFRCGVTELESFTGAYFSTSGDRATLNYWAADYRLGVMLNDPRGEGLWRGSWEGLFKVFAGTVFDGPGNALGGGGCLLRYNFVQPGSRWVPYLQAGVGLLYNDIYHAHEERLFDHAWLFDIEAAVGLRFQINKCWYASLEGGWRHFVDVDLGGRGLNSAGALIGLGLQF